MSAYRSPDGAGIRLPGREPAEWLAAPVYSHFVRFATVLRLILQRAPRQTSDQRLLPSGWHELVVIRADAY